MADRVPTWRPKLDEVAGARPLTPPERRLLAAVRAGELADYGATRPDAATAENTIRAELIRFLLLGGDDANPVHPKGVQARGAWIEGKLDFENCETHLDLRLRNCEFAAPPNLMDAHLGALSLQGCRVSGMNLHRMRTEGTVFLRNGFRSDGTVNLGGARIGGGLDCNDAKFFGTEAGKDEKTFGEALDGNGMTVGADVFLSDGFAALGQVNLVGASITGQLVCHGGSFDGRTRRGADGAEEWDRALNGDAMTVGADVFLSDGFTALGQVNLVGASITGQLACVGGSFDGLTRRGADGVEDRGRALNSEAMVVGADVFLFPDSETSRPFVAKGDVVFRRSRIEGNLRVRAAQIDGKFSCEALRVAAGFTWLDVTGEGLEVDLTEAEVGNLRDDTSSWGQVGRLQLHGFRYRSIENDMTTGERLDWLEKAVPFEAPFDPQPFTQLAGVLRAQGHRRAASRILFRRERRMAKAEFLEEIGKDRDGKGDALTPTRAWFFRVIAFFFRLFFGYGHHPARGLAWSFAIWLVTFWFAYVIYWEGQMAPNSPVILTSSDWLNAVHYGCPLPGDMSPDAKRRGPGCVPPLFLWAGKGDIPAMASAKDYETFSPALYALDLFAPVVELGQVQAWAPSKDRGNWGRIGTYGRWIVEGLGWIIVVMGAAVLTGLVGKRDD